MRRSTRSETPIYLASTSPRRAKLLADACIRFRQRDPGFDDSHIDLSPIAPARATEALAYLKASTVADTLSRGIVIGSDTMVVAHGQVLGKPTDRDDAARMLRMILGDSHQVITGVAMVEAGGDRQMIFHDSTQVTLGGLETATLDRYLDSGQWQGKAGGYNLAELDDWPFRIEGDATTVVGLPIVQLVKRLGQFLQPGAGS
jgi:septum formation protein